jgi:thiol:disulfide interchange protein
MLLYVLLLATLLWPTSSLAEPPEPLDLDLLAVQSEEGLYAVVRISPHHGWHAYANTPGPSGFPTQVEARLNDLPLVPLYLPGEPTPDPATPGQIALLYSSPTPVFIQLPQNASGQLTATVRLLLCSDSTCQPVRRTLQMSIDPNLLSKAPHASQFPWWKLLAKSAPQAPTPPSSPDSSALTLPLPPLTFSPRFFEPQREVHSLAKAIPLALLAGLLLNVMPCVLPVIGLKLRGLLPTHVGATPSHAFRRHNLAFAAGIITFFGILALIVGATGMAWGQLFQSQSTMVALSVLMMLLALSLFGVLDLPILDLKITRKHSQGHELLEAFSTGMLATLLATPCSGPFLGGVLAWTLIQPPPIIITVLMSVGIGMATPYVALATNPRLMRFFPKPGAWMEYLEHGLAFFLLGTALYLVSLVPSEQTVNVLALLWVCALAAWIWGRLGNLTQTRTRRLVWRGIALSFAAGATWWLFQPTPPAPWIPFQPDRFEALRHTQPLLVEFTAQWCPNCKFLEKTTLTPATMAALSQKYGAAIMRVDLTREDPQTMALLYAMGSRSIPLVAIFSPSKPDSPLILRDIFTRENLEAAAQSEWGSAPTTLP